jgi:hypothetical protein
MINFDLIAQVSSSITLLFGVVAIYFTLKAARGLLAGELKGLINLSNIFLILVMIGTSAMVFYHFSENLTAENIWYLFIFVSLIFSLFESYKLMRFGKGFIKKKGKKK